MCRDKNRRRRFDKINGKCKRQFATTKGGISIYKKESRKKRRIYSSRLIREMLSNIKINN